MTQDSLKPQCGTCPSSPPLALCSSCQREEKPSPVLTSFSCPKGCHAFLPDVHPWLQGRSAGREKLSPPPPLCSKSCEIRRHSALPHPEPTLHHFCRRDSSFAMALQNRRELSREHGGRRRWQHQKYLPATETLLLPSVLNEGCNNVCNYGGGFFFFLGLFFLCLRRRVAVWRTSLALILQTSCF